MLRTQMRFMRLAPIVASAVLMLTVLLTHAPLHAQQGVLQPQAGIAVDAQGVLRMVEANDPTGQLTRERMQAARKSLNSDVARRSPMRKISLNRLEKAIEAQLAKGNSLPDDMKYLAGLTRVQNVFFYPETGDIVIAGPAEGYGTDLTGRVIGIDTGRSIVELQDLVVALRAFDPNGKGMSMIGCSIDATQDGLAKMNQFLNSIRGTDPRTPGFAEHVVNGLKTNLGLQKVRIDGVSPNTHFAQVMVEADYRMKLIGIGLEKAPVKIASYVELADAASISRNAMQRWWFVPDYKCVRVSEDGNAMQLEGNGVKLLGENEVVTTDGRRQATGSNTGASARFTQGFTQKYPQLADRSPVYAQLRNLIDLSIAAAFIKDQDYYGRAKWNMATLGDEKKVPVETCTAPVEVETAANAMWKGTTLSTPVGGGVSMHPQEALAPLNVLADEKKTVEKLHDQVDLSKLSEGQWWWD